MFAMSAVMFMTPQLVTPTTVSPPAPNSKTSQPTGFALSARSIKPISRNNNPKIFLLCLTKK